MERDYVLGTHDEEVARLGLQHRVWRPNVLSCWREAGITEGLRVLDIGSGPGYATADLAEIVGPTGAVFGVERSQRFIAVADDICRSRGLSNVTFAEHDLMAGPLPVTGYDASWCRWVACFVSDPSLLVGRIGEALRTGGTAIFHDYINYEGWRMGPSCPLHGEFVRKVIANWEESGGTPNVCLILPDLLHRAGFRIASMKPITFSITPRDFIWGWPSSFVASHVDRLLELGRVKQDWATAFLAEFREAEKNPGTVMLTPTVLEIVAVKGSEKG